MSPRINDLILIPSLQVCNALHTWGIFSEVIVLAVSLHMLLTVLIDASFTRGHMPVATVTRVIVLAPTTLRREAWRALLSNQPDIVVAEAVGGIEQLTSLQLPGQPASLLLDVPALHLDLIQQSRNTMPTVGILALVSSFDLAIVLPLLQAGVTGCLSYDDTVGGLARAIIAVGRGELVLPAHMAFHALAALARGENGLESPAGVLSEREVTVLRLLAQGKTNKHIAQTLMLSVRTVEAHLRSIFVKIDVRSRTEAVLWAVKHGYGAEQ